jgi:CubicO group peptidase (beta-lactamase class C family)
LLGAGDVVGSASDWVHAWEALLQGRLAGPAAPRWTPLLDMALPDPDSRSWYGLGVMAMDWRDARGRARLWLAHTGGARDGGNAVVLWDPLVGAFAAVAVNGTGSAVAIANALLTALEDSAGSTP